MDDFVEKLHLQAELTKCNLSYFALKLEVIAYKKM